MELFNAASLVDFTVARTSSTAEALRALGEDDACEVGLRRIASYIHEKRTGDRDASASMLAIKPAGGQFDLAPEWLVSQASIYAQSEYKRKERAKSFNKGASKGDGKGGEAKGGGKAPAKKGGKAQAPRGSPKGKPPDKPQG